MPAPTADLPRDVDRLHGPSIATAAPAHARLAWFAATFKTVVFSLLPLTLLYLVSETLLSLLNVRPFDPLPESRPPVRTTMTSPWGDVRPIREQLFFGVRTLFESTDFRAFVPPVEKPPGLSRIAFVGDSFVFGVGVEEYDTLPRLVASYLGYFAPALHVETINLGIPGANTQTYARVIETAARYRPELVVVGFTIGNDAEIVPGSDRTDVPASADPSLVPADAGAWRRLGSLRDLRDAIVSHSRTLTMLYRPLRRIESRRRQDLYMHTTFDDPAKWAAVQANLRTIADFCRARSIPVVLFLYPYMFSTPGIGLNDVATYRYDEHHARTRRAAEAVGLRVIDGLDYFREDGVPSLDPYLVPGDGHPNAAFNGLVARHLAGAIVNHDWFPVTRASDHRAS